MSRQNKNKQNYQQSNLLSSKPQDKLDEESEFDDIDLASLTAETLGIDEEDNRTVELQKELLTLKLLREAIQKRNPDDQVMVDFANYVLPNLLRLTVGVTAKGGKFFDRIDRRRQAEGKTEVRRDNAGDQSLKTNLLNGLFPANLIEKRLEKLDTNAKRYIKELERRLVIAGFILHDFEKFAYQLFASIPDKYKEISQDFDQDIRKLSLEEHREIFRLIIPELGIDSFLFPEDSEQYQKYLDDLLYIAYNAQWKNDTNLNLSEDGLQPKLKSRVLHCLADLTCLADRLASVIKHPQDAVSPSLNTVLHELSDGQLQFSYHSIAENRGVLTNVVNNAVMEAHTVLNTEETYYEPLVTS